MAISLAGQVALVTGGGRGLGRSYALDLARHGAKVVVVDFGGDLNGRGSDPSVAEAVVAEIKAAGGEAIASVQDVSTYEGGYNAVKSAMDAWGRLDAAVCNAGILRDAAIHNMGEDDWDAVLDTHLKGCYTVLRAAWPVFRQQGYGRAVLASSSSGLYGNFGQTNYASAKAGMVGMMNVLKLEGAKYNVMVNCLGPAAMTRMTEGLMTVADVASMSPDHVAPVVTYLCSSACTEAGLVIEAAGGRYNRCSFVRGPGITFGGKAVKDADWVAANWAQIISLEGAEPMWNIRETRAAHYAEK